MLVADPVFTELSPSRSTRAGRSTTRSWTRSTIIGEMHEDGTLTDLSEQWFDEDLTQEPAE